MMWIFTTGIVHELEEEEEKQHTWLSYHGSHSAFFFFFYNWKYAERYKMGMNSFSTDLHVIHSYRRRSRT